MSEIRCKCALVDVSSAIGPYAGQVRYMLGRSDECPIHQTAEERRQHEAWDAEEAEREAIRAAAERAAREAP